jgi:hypothetical protein
LLRLFAAYPKLFAEAFDSAHAGMDAVFRQIVL